MNKLLVVFLFSSLAVLHAEWTDKITMNGYFNVEFEDRISGDEHDRADEHASFDSDMLDIVLNIQATDKLRIAVDFTWEHGSQTEVGKGNVGYEYAFAEYIVKDEFKIRSGKMFTPFGIYNEIHTAKPTTIITKEPNPTNKMYFMTHYKDDNGPTYEQTLLYPRWGTGIAFLGNTELLGMPLDYIVQITNGDLSYGVEENEYDKDDNDHKAISSRVRVDVTDDLQLGASYYHDVMSRYDSNEDIVGTMAIDSYGLQMVWHISDDFRLEAEYMRGTLDVENITSFGRSGYSILPSYFISENVNLYFLYAQADPNHTKDKDRVLNYAPGVNIELDNNVFLKIDVFNVVSEDKNSLYEGKEFAEFRTALAIGF